MSTAEQTCDHSELLNALISRQSLLTTNRMQYIVYAAALACQNKYVLHTIENLIGEVTLNQHRDIHHAVMRMAAANPYYMAINTLQLNCNTNNAMQLSPLRELDVEDETSYYYACVAACLVNKGYSCLKSHVELLRTLNESDESINTALRLTSSVMTMCQANFNSLQFSDC